MIFRNKKNQKGFTLIETITYLFITSMLVLVIASLVLSIFKARRQLQSSHAVHQNARFIINYLNNCIHNVDIIDDVSPASEQLHFYQMPDIRFSLAIEGDSLVYREVQDIGSGFPDQSTATPLFLNSNTVAVSNLSMTPINDSFDNLNQGIVIGFTITKGGDPVDLFGYSQKDFNTFLSIR